MTPQQQNQSQPFIIPCLQPQSEKWQRTAATIIRKKQEQQQQHLPNTLLVPPRNQQKLISLLFDETKYRMNQQQQTDDNDTPPIKKQEEEEKSNHHHTSSNSPYHPWMTPRHGTPKFGKRIHPTTKTFHSSRSHIISPSTAAAIYFLGPDLASSLD